MRGYFIQHLIEFLNLGLAIPGLIHNCGIFLSRIEPDITNPGIKRYNNKDALLQGSFPKSFKKFKVKIRNKSLSQLI